MNITVRNEQEKDYRIVEEITRAAFSYPERIARGGIPFAVTLPKAPGEINADFMTEAQFHEKLQKGYDDVTTGNAQDAAGAFARFRETHVKGRKENYSTGAKTVEHI